MRKFLNRVDWAASRAVMGLTAALVAIVSVEVFLRYVVNYSMIFSNELSRLCFVWIIFLTMPLGVAKGYHVGITLLDNVMKGAAVRIAFRLTVLLTLCLMGLVIFVSVNSVVDRWGEMLSTLPVPASVFFLPIVIGAVHSFLHLLVQLIEGERPSRPDIAGEVS